MPDNDKTLKTLKRIAASGGKLQGSFMIVSDGGGTTAGLVVTLAARDPKGDKAKRAGRALRKELGVTRFGRGTVRLADQKLLFELLSGNLSAGVVKKAFRQAFDGPLQKRLRAARVAAPDAAAEDIAEDVVTAEEADSELAEIIASQSTLAEQNVLLTESFLSVAEEAAERAALAADILEEIETLEAAGLGDAARLRDLRAELAATVAVGTEQFPAPGKPLPPVLMSLMTDATDALQDLSDVFHGAAYQRARLDFEAHWQSAQAPLLALATQLRGSGDPDLIAIANGGLSALLEPLAQAVLADLDARPADKAEQFAQHLLQHPAVAAIDDNPFGVDVALRGQLAPSLLRLAQADRARETA